MVTLYLFQVPDLQPGTCYTFAVSVSNSQGTGLSSPASEEYCTASCGNGVVCSEGSGCKSCGELIRTLENEAIPVIVAMHALSMPLELVNPSHHKSGWIRGSSLNVVDPNKS